MISISSSVCNFIMPVKDIKQWKNEQQSRISYRATKLEAAMV